MAPQRLRPGVVPRAVALLAGSLCCLGLLWWARPGGAAAGPATATDAVVRGCAALAWVLAGYVVLGVVVSTVVQLTAADGTLARVVAAALPRAVGRCVQLALTAGLVGAAVVPAASAATPAQHLVTAVGSATHGASDPLDWPGLGPVAADTGGGHGSARAGAHDSSPAGHAAAHRSTRRSRVEPAAPRPQQEVVVRPGDSLWSIAARELGDHAGPGAVARAWPRWYAANRSVVGADPDVIRPGLRLRPPTPTPTPPPTSRSPR